MNNARHKPASEAKLAFNALVKCLHEGRTMEEAYFVVSDGEEALKVFFSLKDASKGGYPYIDIFDGSGNKLRALKLVGDEYTSDF